jgi:hypothetical protein
MLSIPVTILIADDIDEISDAVNALAMIGYGQMVRAAKRGHPFPDLFTSGVRYVPEKVGAEDWKTAARVFKDKTGDCEDLAATLCAQTWFRGDRNARVYARLAAPGLIHMLVRASNGTTIDPSRVLGMRGAA